MEVKTILHCLCIEYKVMGHGLVDFISGFNVKTPPRNAIITKEFFFRSASELTCYLLDMHKIDHWEYIDLGRKRGK